MFSLALLVTSLYQFYLVIDSNSDAPFAHPSQNGGETHRLPRDKDGKWIEPNLRKITSLGKGNQPKIFLEDIDENKRDRREVDLDKESKDGVDNIELRRTELSDIFISVKTTQPYHSERLDLLLETWHILARDEVSAYLVLIKPHK